jgi:hypothetical protein
MLSQQHRFYPADHPSSQQPYDPEDISLFYSPVPTFYPHKRIKVSAHLDFTAGILPSPRDCSSLAFHSAMPAPPAFARPPHPAVSLHRASEPPASPATIASTLSNHSTPAPSPPCLTIRSDNHSPTDFPLIDDAYPLHEQHPKPPLDPRYHQHYNAAFAGYQHAPVPAPAPAPAPSTSSPWSSPYTSQQQQQQLQRQQYYHHAMPAYNGNSSYGARCSNPRPSVSDVNMPATPVHSPVHRENGGCGGVQHPPPPPSSSSSISHSGPSLSRTVSDAMQDELYNPGIAPGIAHSRPEHPTDLSGSRLPDLLQQAQNQHAMACSPPASASFGGAAYNLAQSRRQAEADHEAKALQKKIKPEFDPPKTISPKDAYNDEYHEPDGPIRGSLFSNGDAYSQHGRTDIDIKSESDGSLPDIDVDDDEYDDDDDDGHSYDGHSYDGHSNYDGMTTSRRHSDVVMEDYMYGAGDSAQPRYGDRLTVPGSTYHQQWAGEEGSSSQAGGASSDETYDHHQQHHHHHNHHHPQPLQRPEDTKANDGAYSCTVHGCTRRFSTASKMSKHRREVHRPSTPLSRDAITGAPTKSLLQGPSRCARINPTTGKPCNTIFSRPYDLTRHEDTIHNTARQKVRCEICTDDKTFSRQDALTRHKKVKHGIDKAP